ncbi:MAG: hypothetical protein PHO32_08780, partial [Candidatus Cloacimonetes bacterium]|nr:hypothetical protein [Candidatus Cloacimonadota bacterium]
MFKACIVSAFLFMFMSVAHSLTWYYDFGLSNAEYSIASSESWSFLPPAQAGISKIKLGDAGGYIRLQNPGLGSLGINSELQIAASASGNNNKFSLYNYPGSGLFYTSFDILFGDNSGAGTVSQGTFYFSQGNGDSFTNNGGFVAAEMFSGLQWVFGSNGSLTLKYRNGSTWSVLGASNVFQGILYSVELYGNNSGTNTTYYRGGNAYVLAYNKQDIWINGVRIGGLSKGGIAGGSNID